MLNNGIMNKKISQILISCSGLGCSPITFFPLEVYLNLNGFKNTYRISYAVDKQCLKKSIDDVDAELTKRANKSDNEIIIIGQSMGGRVANELHTYGWKIKFAVYIGAPLKGARLLNKLESWVPTFIRNLLYKTPYTDLKKEITPTPPPHPYHTISMGWFGSSFDGCVAR